MDKLVETFGSVDMKFGVCYKRDDVVDYVMRNKPKNVGAEFFDCVEGEGEKGYFLRAKSLIKGDFICAPGDIVALPQAYQRYLEAKLEDGGKIRQIATLQNIFDFITTKQDVNGDMPGAIRDILRSTDIDFLPTIITSWLREYYVYKDAQNLRATFDLRRDYFKFSATGTQYIGEAPYQTVELKDSSGISRPTLIEELLFDIPNEVFSEKEHVALIKNLYKVSL